MRACVRVSIPLFDRERERERERETLDILPEPHPGDCKLYFLNHVNESKKDKGCT